MEGGEGGDPAAGVTFTQGKAGPERPAREQDPGNPCPGRGIWGTRLQPQHGALGGDLKSSGPLLKPFQLPYSTAKHGLLLALSCTWFLPHLLLVHPLPDCSWALNFC